MVYYIPKRLKNFGPPQSPSSSGDMVTRSGLRIPPPSRTGNLRGRRVRHNPHNPQINLTHAATAPALLLQRTPQNTNNLILETWHNDSNDSELSESTDSEYSGFSDSERENSLTPYPNFSSPIPDNNSFTLESLPSSPEREASLLSSRTPTPFDEDLEEIDRPVYSVTPNVARRIHRIYVITLLAVGILAALHLLSSYSFNFGDGEIRVCKKQ